MSVSFSHPTNLMNVKKSRDVLKIESIMESIEKCHDHGEYPIGVTSNINDFVKVSVKQDDHIVDICGHVDLGEEIGYRGGFFGTMNNYESMAAILRYFVEIPQGYGIEVRKELVGSCIKYVTFVTWKV